MAPPSLSDNPDAPDAQEVLRQLNYAKCAFQLRTIGAVLGAGQASASPHDWFASIPSFSRDWPAGVLSHVKGSTDAAQ